jgi:hypothetical protein
VGDPLIYRQRFGGATPLLSLTHAILRRNIRQT